ncbi:MAG: hypothetical protein QOE11_247 [Solirubrobacteraceae bacterium]|nr:hypothetical protein [Solirubrobacteraceae bacterium]
MPDPRDLRDTRAAVKHSVAVAAATALLAASPAMAAAVPSFTAAAAGDQTIAFDASASTCEFGLCGYDWRWADGTRLGATIGSGVTVTFRFSRPGWQTVVLTVSQHCAPGSPNWCPRSLAHQVFVAGPDPVAPPAPVVTPDPAAAPAAAAPAAPVATAAPDVAVAPETVVAPAPAPVSAARPAARPHPRRHHKHHRRHHRRKKHRAQAPAARRH